MKTSLTSASFSLLLAAMLLVPCAVLVRAQDPSQPAAPETLTATVIGTGGAASGKTFGITININSYSTEGDASVLLASPSPARSATTPITFARSPPPKAVPSAS